MYKQFMHASHVFLKKNTPLWIMKNKLIGDLVHYLFTQFLVFDSNQL